MERQVDLGMGKGLKPGSLFSRSRSISNLSQKPKTVEANMTKKSSSKHGRLCDSSSKPVETADGSADQLRQDLDSLRNQLDAKNRALKILHQENTCLRQQCEEYSKTLERQKEASTLQINSLQFELEYSSNILMDSQQTWGDRFNKVLGDTLSVQEALHTETDKVRVLSAEKVAWIRERNELLSLLDVNERMRYEEVKADASSDELYNTFTSAELSILGACTCRNVDPTPCECCHAAAKLKRDLTRVRQLMDSERQANEETFAMVEAYRSAFEEQLQRNKALTRQFGELTFPTSRSQKLKSIAKWMLKQLTEDEAYMLYHQTPIAKYGSMSSLCSPASVVNSSGGSIASSGVSCSGDSGRAVPGLLTDQELLHTLLTRVAEKSASSAMERLSNRLSLSRDRGRNDSGILSQASGFSKE